ncbi:MAG TPA: hypothetical protein VF669_23045 [Tepidisphaeraceae bacterium]|jgi:hypothetical protein
MASRTCYFAVACDTDPDALPPYRTLPSGTDPLHLWTGLTQRVPALREALSRTGFQRQYGPLPITWLLRADRQIAEVYGDAGFSYRAFEKLWTHERTLGSEIGWHPHLYRWNNSASRWEPDLDHDEDQLAMLEESLTALRQHAPIQSVRNGWNYHSTALMSFYAGMHIAVDASPIPGSVEFSRGWHHDWSGTPRKPYCPSASDYRRPATASENVSNILACPTLVRDLSLPLRLARHIQRIRRTRGKGRRPTWDSARWQGQYISRMASSFSIAVRQWMAENQTSPSPILVTYFHPDEILTPSGIATFLANLDEVQRLLQSGDFEIVPTTLSKLAAIATDPAQSHLKTPLPQA